MSNSGFRKGYASEIQEKAINKFMYGRSIVEGIDKPTVTCLHPQEI